MDQDLAFFENTVVPLIRIGLDLGSGPAPDGIDCDRLITLAKRHSLLPAVREGLRKAGAADGLYKQVDENCAPDIFRFMFRDHALESISKCFENNALPYVLLKGSVIRDLYPEQWMRTSCDIDVLVKEEDVDRAVTALEAETEFKFEKRLYHDVTMNAPHVHLELHFSIKENMDNIDPLLSRVWEYAEKESGYRYRLSPEYQIFHVAAHMSYHFVHSGLGVRHFIDLWLLRHRTAYDESAVRDMCESCGILKFYEECCALSEVWLGSAEHSPVTRALEAYSVGGGVFGSRRNEVLSRQRKHRGAGYYLRRMFVSKAVLKVIFPELERRPALLPYYQVKRWALALGGKRERIKREIREVSDTSAEEIESFDELMRSVGL